MDLLVWIILFSLLGGVLSVMAAGLFLLLPAKQRDRLLPHSVSFAIGALLGAAFLALIPHAVTGVSQGGANSFGMSPGSIYQIEIHNIGLTILLGMLGFFLLEKMVLWRHCHTTHCEAHAPHSTEHHNAAGTLILIGDGIHNLVDGVLIAAAFMTDIHLGIVTSLAVATHEIPQEVGDFAVLLNSGYSRSRALWMNVAVSLTTVIGAVAAYFALAEVRQVLPYILSVAASSFIYIAVADLIPGLHKRTQFSATVQQIVLILAGILCIYFAHSTLH
ncbi:MAG: ZIP family metal transporter [Gammaproteobacteria bacterium]|nr:ZIP family metal transporter [Gammaproteobacteria bacterium]MDH5651476.1 ZIP family metal transporter [Gammaproteobacteria bacterium]